MDTHKRLMCWQNDPHKQNLCDQLQKAEAAFALTGWAGWCERRGGSQLPSNAVLQLMQTNKSSLPFLKKRVQTEIVNGAIGHPAK